MVYVIIRIFIDVCISDINVLLLTGKGYRGKLTQTINKSRL